MRNRFGMRHPGFQLKALLEGSLGHFELFIRMFPSFFSALLTCTLTPPALASANPDPLVICDPTTLSFSRLLNELTNGQTLHHRDVLRAQSFKAHGDFQKGSELSKRAEISTPADNRVVSYVASVGVGSPPTQCKVMSILVQWTSPRVPFS